MIADAVAILGFVVFYLLFLWWVPVMWAEGSSEAGYIRVARVHVWILLVVWFLYSSYWLFEVLT